MTLQLSQMLQGFGIKLGAEYWRQIRPRATGCVFWQYNDIWLGMSWSSVDYFGRWKALHYLARKFYSPVLVSAAENDSTRSADLFISSDLMTDQHGKLEWSVTDLSGEVLAKDLDASCRYRRKSVQVKTRPATAGAKSRCRRVFDLAEAGPHGKAVSWKTWCCWRRRRSSSSSILS